ncbi:MAG: hypothetical protein HY360_21135 [Verrucomicrobia bacterium]|nr:hypothetical protein [Verrucomicrobiota bacterium]
MKTKHLINLSKQIRIELLIRPEGEFVGLGDFSIAGVALRDGRQPFVVRLETPDGVLYPKFILEKIHRRQDSVEVVLRATGIPWGRGEYQDDYNQNLYHLALPAGKMADRLTLLFASAKLTLDGREFVGFAYSFRFKSGSRKIHRLLTHATWEIGGRITGNTVLSQGQCNRPVYRGARRTLFTTACLRTLAQYGSLQGNSFQLGPRAGLLQGFDFQHSTDGVLFQYWPDFQSVSSLIESPVGADRLHVVDEYRFPLARNVRTTPKHVLFSKGRLGDHKCRDLWLAACEQVYGGIKRRHGIQPTVVRPECGLVYTAKFVGKKFKITVQGEPVDPPEVLYALADRTLPVLARQGIRRFFPEAFQQNDVTELGMRRKLDDGIHGGLCCSSVCATHRFFPSKFWGGIKAWRYFAKRGRALGIEIGHWFAPHFSPRAAIFEQHPEWRMVDVNGMPAGGGYGFQTLVVADWNTGIYDWALADLRRWQEEGGLDYLFTDSLSNMGLLQCNYAAAMRTNFKALGRFYADLQRIGIKALSFECISAFGCSRFGAADLRGDLLQQDRAVAGQNDFGWWVGEEDMAYNVTLCTAPRKRTPSDLRRILFRTMANRGFVMYGGLANERHELPAWHHELNHIQQQVVADMQTRHVLPAGRGIEWTNGPTRIIWTYRDIALSVTPAARVERISGRGAEPVKAMRVLKAGHVYRLR